MAGGGGGWRIYQSISSAWPRIWRRKAGERNAAAAAANALAVINGGVAVAS